MSFADVRAGSLVVLQFNGFRDCFGRGAFFDAICYEDMGLYASQVSEQAEYCIGEDVGCDYRLCYKSRADVDFFLLFCSFQSNVSSANHVSGVCRGVSFYSLRHVSLSCYGTGGDFEGTLVYDKDIFARLCIFSDTFGFSNGRSILGDIDNRNRTTRKKIFRIYISAELLSYQN